MYAVIATGGKQYRVSPGETVDVEQLDLEPGQQTSLQPLLVVDDDGAVTHDAEALASASVTASVVDQHRGEKLTIFKYKPKTGYRKKAGHRQSVTRLRIDEVSLSGTGAAEHV
jgi:large subunit ribosomal protein L21